MWARIQDGLAAEVTFDNPEGRFHPSLQWAEVPPELAPWLPLGLRLGPDGIEPEDPAAFKEAIKTRLQNRRWLETNRGVEFNGHRFQTDSEARGNLTSSAKLGELYEAAFGAGVYRISYQAMDGFVSLALGDVYAVGMAVGAFVQACFGRQEVIANLIDAAADWQSALAAYNDNIDQGWPS